MKSSVFWDITPCDPLNGRRRFGGIHYQGQRISKARNQREAGSKQSLYKGNMLKKCVVPFSLCLTFEIYLMYPLMKLQVPLVVNVLLVCILKDCRFSQLAWFQDTVC
jgi:hypothetical protein